MLRRRIAVTALSLIPLAAACTTVATLPPQAIEAKTPSMVWVTKGDNSTVLVQSPELRTDTLAGFVGGDYVEMPLSDVHSMRARISAPGKTRLLVGGVTLAVAAAVIVATKGGGSGAGIPECIGGFDANGNEC